MRPDQRPLVVDDLFRVQNVRNPVFSPDGRWLAYEVTRPVGEEPIRRLTFFDQIHCDVWLAPVSGGTPRNLTEGSKTGDGFWNPVWPPSGSRLAMLGIHEGRVRARIWEAATDALTPLSDLPIKHQYWLEGLGWLSDQKIAVITWSSGSSEPCRIRVQTRPGEGPAERWAQSWSGMECTATVLSSGDGPWPAMREAAHAQLWILDVEDGSRQLVDEGNLHRLSVSPDGRFLAYFKSTPEVPQMAVDRPSPGMFDWGEYHLLIAQLDAPPCPVATVQLHSDMSTLTWSPAGTQLALLRRPASDGTVQASPAVLQVNVPEGTCRVLSPPHLMIRSLTWTSDNRMVVSAQSTPEKEDGTGSERADWWLARDDGGWDNLTAEMDAVPDRLTAAGPALVGISSGRIWRIDRDGAAPTPLISEPAGEIVSVSWLTPALPTESREAILVVGLKEEAEEGLFLGRAGVEGAVKLEALARPTAAAAVAQAASDGRTVVFTGEDQSGSFLWMVEAGLPTPPAPLVALNTWVAEIAEVEIQILNYRSLDGQELKAELLLPFGYEAGCRYPLITSVYPGAMVQEPAIDPITVPFPYTVRLLAAHGYAVLFPSMPLPAGACDPYLEMLKGVMPAVDRAIDLGIADPKRLGLMGHSGGGWAVYSLVTQTTRFQAAIASAGLTDLESAYGTFDPSCRYGDLDRPYTAFAYLAKMFEQGYIRMGGPPWKETERYHRNSPISYVDRVQTPLLMLHGDWDDGCWVTQAEQFFTALFRQGKPACLLRYDGEGHLVAGEANVRDLWSRIYQWFDHYLTS